MTNYSPMQKADKYHRIPTIISYNCFWCECVEYNTYHNHWGYMLIWSYKNAVKSNTKCNITFTPQQQMEYPKYIYNTTNSRYVTPITHPAFIHHTSTYTSFIQNSSITKSIIQYSHVHQSHPLYIHHTCIATIHHTSIETPSNTHHAFNTHSFRTAEAH